MIHKEKEDLQGILQLNKPIMHYRPDKSLLLMSNFLFYIIVYMVFFYKGMIYYIQGFQHRKLLYQNPKILNLLYRKKLY